MKERRIFYGWRIVAAGMGVLFLMENLFLYGFSAFFIPWRNTFGWSRALLGGVSGFARLEGGVMGPITGWLIDKYGPRRMMLLGLGMMGLGFIALSQINSLVMLYIVYVGLLAAGSSFGTFRPVQVAVANWFIRYRGRAMGLVQVGSGIGGSFVFLFALFINTFGWRAGAVLAGLLILFVGLPLTSLIRHRPEQMGLLPDGERVSPEVGVGDSTPQERAPDDSQAWEAEGKAPGLPQSPKTQRFWLRDPRPEIDLTAWQAIRCRAFWMMAISYSIWGTTVAFVTVHMAPFLEEELDLEYVVAVSALSFYAFASLGGRGGFGFLADYVNVRSLLVVLFLVQGLGVFLFSQVHTLAQVPIYLAILAPAYGGAITLRGVLQGYLFGRKYFGTVGGFMAIVNLPTNVAAPIWIGWLADAVPGGYRIAFQIIAALLVVGAFCLLLARRPRPPLPADRPPLLLQILRRR